ncbi:hypothetical protein Rs2_09246 [Raphanus sativus]|nr:hypothetical protein Rs2_09246 [Raphanus sativus]
MMGLEQHLQDVALIAARVLARLALLLEPSISVTSGPSCDYLDGQIGFSGEVCSLLLLSACLLLPVVVERLQVLVVQVFAKLCGEWCQLFGAAFYASRILPNVVSWYIKGIIPFGNASSRTRSFLGLAR